MLTSGNFYDSMYGQWGTIMKSFSVGCASAETCEVIGFRSGAVEHEGTGVICSLLDSPLWPRRGNVRWEETLW